VISSAEGAVPDVLAPGVKLVFCGINPGHRSARAGAAFANPRNDFWRLLHAAGFTPRQLEPTEQAELLGYGSGLTNAARRTTRGSGDLRAADFAGARERLEQIAAGLRPRVIAFVGKAAYQVSSASGRAWASRNGSWAAPSSSCCPRRHRRTPPSPGTSGFAGSARSRGRSMRERRLHDGGG
jgi:TDG/mug DNA glycosylase family protein